MFVYELNGCGFESRCKKEGLLKRFKNIESKSNNQLLALKNINKPVIRGKDDDDHDDDINNNYKKIVEDYKNNKIEYKKIKEQLNKTIGAIKIYIKK